MARVAIVDDHPVTRRGLEAMLGTEFEVVASVGTVAGLPDPATLDLVVLDLYLNDDTPSVAAVQELVPRVKVLIMSASRAPKDVLATVRAGASGYVTKHSEPGMIVSAVQTVLAGGFALSAELASILQQEMAEPEVTEKPVLSQREEEALRWIARGFTHAQTATRMGVSKATVDTYVERIRGKLQVGNKAELTQKAIELERRRHTGER